jgi:uncharacterized membrane protein
MNLLKLALRPEIVLPVKALALASAVCADLAVTRGFWTGNHHYFGLLWNLFLAWTPLVFALLACEEFRNHGIGRHWCFPFLATGWLLLFPNAPYICTDITHLFDQQYGHFWVDITLVLSCAFTGLVLGFLSLYLMQSLVARKLGQIAGWFFVVFVSLLGSFGIYLGRFLRFNSWDVLWRPSSLYHGVHYWASNPFGDSTTFVFPALFAVFFFITYVMLYGISHLQQPRLEADAPAVAAAPAPVPEAASAIATPQASSESKV